MDSSYFTTCCTVVEPCEGAYIFFITLKYDWLDEVIFKQFCYYWNFKFGEYYSINFTRPQQLFEEESEKLDLKVIEGIRQTQALK